VLPTASSAKSFNGLETRSFMRRTSIVQYTKEAMLKEVETIERFGNMEQLDGHGFAGTVRRNG
jgi:histidinol dehydrogenase